MDEKQTERALFLIRYIRQMISDERQGKITREEWEREFDLIADEISRYETEVYGEEKSSPTCPELASMGEIADEFFEYTEGICSMKSLD